MNRLLRNIGWLLTGRGLNALLSLVYLALATRTLGGAPSGTITGVKPIVGTNASNE